MSTFRFSEGLSSTWQPLSDTAPQPALPAEGPVRSLRQQFSRCANVCRVMPFRPCYLRVRPLLDPDLCWTCAAAAVPVSRRAARRTQHGYPAARRPAVVGHPLGQPPIPAIPAATPGITHRDERNVRRGIKPPISMLLCLSMARMMFWFFDFRARGMLLWLGLLGADTTGKGHSR